MSQVPHVWVKANLGHSPVMCQHCCGTPAEIAVIGDMNHCEKAAEAQNNRSMEALAALQGVIANFRREK